MFDGSLYGNFRTRTFADIFPSMDVFSDFYNTNGAFPVQLSEQSIDTVWALLYARHGNDPIRSSDEARFKFQVMSIIFQYGPTWEKKLSLQKSLRDLEDKDIRAGTYVTQSAGVNPSTKLTDAQIESAGANSYNRQKTTKGAVEAYAVLYRLLEDDVTEDFIAKFATLFRMIALPDAPLWYQNPNIEED